jgi:L-cysteine/cystine lyase
MPDPEKSAAIRAAIPAVAAGIYLNTGSVGPMPAETAAAMTEAHDYDRDVGRGHPARLDELLMRMAEARAGVAAVLGTDVDAVALVHSVTDGMNAASLLPDWHRGDRVVTTTLEHAAALGPLVSLRDRSRVEIVFVEPDPEGDDDRTVAAFDAAITPTTRLVSISHVSWSTGARLPVARIAAVARERGALVVVDGAQAAGAIPFRFDDLGVDLYALPAQKWLLGPEAMGAVVIDRTSVERLTPALAGWLSFERFDGHGSASWWADARRYEWSPFALPALVGMARSIGWMSMYVGLEFVYRRGAEMARFAIDRLAAIPGVTVLTPVRAMANLVSFSITGWSAQAALDELGARTFVIARTIPTLDAIRISPAFFTTEDDIERFVSGVSLLAAHTPETLPPRRTLSILGER